MSISSPRSLTVTASALALAMVLRAALAEEPAATPKPGASSTFATPAPATPAATPAPNLTPQLSPPPVKADKKGKKGSKQEPATPAATPNPYEVEHVKPSVDWFDGRPTEPLSLRGAIEQALKNNLEVQFENTGIRVQRAQVKFAAGAFDPVFSMAAQYQSIQRPTDINNPSTTQAILQQQQLQLQLNQAAQQLNIANQQLFQNQLVNQQQQSNINQQLALQGITPSQLPNGITSPTILPTQQIVNPTLQNIIVLNQTGYQFQASVGGRLPYGTRYALQDTLNASRNTFSGDIQPVENLYENSVGISIQQPLLKSFGKDANLADLRTARINQRVQTLTWKNSISVAVQNVMAAYYDMDFALKDLQVREDAMAADAKLVGLYKRRVDLGFGSPYDIRQAEVAVATDRERLLNQKNLFLQRQYALKQLISHTYEVDDPRIFVPTNAPDLKPPRLGRTALLQQAFEKRYDYRGLVLNAEASDVRLKFARNQLLPSLDLVATFGLNGLGENSVGRSLNDTFGLEHPQWSLGLQFQLPFGNHQAKAQYDAILSQKEQAILRLKQREIDVGVSVDLALSTIETLRQSMAAARETREVGEEAVRIAGRRLEEGLISAYDITDQQRKLYDAKTRELAVEADLNKAVTQLWLATGTVLENQGIVFDEPNTPVKNPPIPKAEMIGAPSESTSKTVIKRR
jgi:outer membrane protein TolC